MKTLALLTLSLALVFTVVTGVRLRPNLTDGFAGAAPDLGAIELGQATPHYGPRD
jgi:hypothetical protein